MTDQPLDWFHATSDAPENGRSFERQAHAAERAAVVSSLRLGSCDDVEVRYELRALAGGRYRLQGRLRARLTQPCVVSLEPVQQQIDEDFEVLFWPADSIPDDSGREREILSEPDIEPIRDGKLPVGRVVFDLLAAAIDPFPRKDDAEFAWSDPKATNAAANTPFAVLAGLKGKP